MADITTGSPTSGVRPARVSRGRYPRGRRPAKRERRSLRYYKGRSRGRNSRPSRKRVVPGWAQWTT